MELVLKVHVHHPFLRHLAKKWSVTLFLGTCLLYCTRMTMPICVVLMAQSFHWTKIDSGVVLGGFFWGYCFTQILGGHASDRWAQRSTRFRHFGEVQE